MTMILIADEDYLIVELVRASLEPLGYIVGAVDDGAPVLRVVQLKRPDLVILDCGLPEVPGIEALHQIRGSHNVYDTPVLMLTGRRSEADEDIALRAGANDYLRKPFDPDQLAARVNALLDMAKAKKNSEQTARPFVQPRQHAWGVR
jgi:DNA-binding response OmpR family regulator